MHCLNKLLSVLGEETPENKYPGIIVYLPFYPKGFALLSVCFFLLIFVVGYEPACLRPDDGIKKQNIRTGEHWQSKNGRMTLLVIGETLDYNLDLSSG